MNDPVPGTSDRAPEPGEHPPGRRAGLLADGLLLAVSLGLYGHAMARDLAWGDSAELALVAATFAVPHPTGYPLYMILARSLVAAGCSPVTAIGVIGVTASALVLVLLRRLMGSLGVPIFLAAPLALLYGVSREAWVQAAKPEVYGLHMAFTAAILWLAVTVPPRPDPGRTAAGPAPAPGSPAGGGRPPGRVLALSALAGLSLANHLLSVFLAPAVLLALLGAVWIRPFRGRTDRRGPGPGPGSGVPSGPGPWLAGAFAAPLLLYAVLPWAASREPPVAWGDPRDPGAFWSHVTGRQFAYRMLGSPDRTLAGDLARAGEHLAVQFDPVGIGVLVLAGLALAGLTRPGRRGRDLGILLVAGVGTTLYALTYNIPDKGAYFLPGTMILVCLAGVGLDRVAAGPGRRPDRVPVRPGHRMLPLVLAGWVLVPVAWNQPHADHSNDTSLRDYMTDITRSLPPAGSLVLVEDLSLWMAAVHLQKVEGRLGGIRFVCTYLCRLPWYLDQLARLYPALTIPDGLAADLDAWQRRLDEVGDATGERSQAIAEEVQRRLVDASLGTYPVFFVPFGFRDELATLGGRRLDPETLGLVPHTPWHLRSRGILYQLGYTPPDGTSPALELASPLVYSTAHQVLPHARGLAKRYATAWNRLGIRRIKEGRHVEARQAFLRAVAHDPAYAGAWANLGVLHQQHLKDHGKVAAYFSRAVELDPDGDQAEAMRRWVEALTRK